MRKVVVYMLLSVDGVAEAPEDFVVDFDQVMNDHLGEAIGRQDTVLLGRVTYQEWAGYWPTATEQPFADFINGVQKYVATSSPLAKNWANTTAIDGSVTDFVRDLKSRSGNDIGVHGSITLAQSLLAEGLVDELRLVVVPTVLGAGRRLFDGTGSLPNVELIESGRSPSGSLLVGYRVAGG